MRRLLVVVLLVAAFGVLLRGQVPCDLLGTQPACEVAMRPGPTANTLEMVEISGERTFDSAGRLYLTTVVQDANLGLLEWLEVRFSPRDDTVPRDVVFPPGVTSEDVAEENALLMERSQTEAMVAGLVAAGFDPADLFEGARIVGIADDPAEGADVLAAEDVIVAVDGETVTRADQAVALVGQRSPGDRIVLTLEDGRDVPLTAGVHPDDPNRALLGLLLSDAVDLPFEIAIDAGNIGGPSAGLMFALGIVDLLDPVDLTHGEVIAGTGTITVDGVVGPIGGIRQKIAGATAPGEDDDDPPATVFLVPSGNADQARTATAGGDVLLVPVATIEEAIAALRALASGQEPDGAFALAAG